MWFIYSLKFVKCVHESKNTEGTWDIKFVLFVINLVFQPIEKDYRNKAEMTIGTSPEGEGKF